MAIFFNNELQSAPMVHEQITGGRAQITGGEGGFEEFMRIMSNPEDPEYENMKRWAEFTGAKAESLEEINKKLRWL